MTTPPSQSKMDPNAARPPGVRRPFHGSCHCGHVKYIVYLTLPPPLVTSNSTIRIQKCNCSSCHKMSIFHTKPADPPNDFLLLSPLNPENGGLSDYTCFDEEIHFYFCGKCGVRCFLFSGEGENRQVELDGQQQEVWAPKREGWVSEIHGYLTINASTLEPGQQGLDLKEWHEKGWISYLNVRADSEEERLRDPFPGGIY